MKQERLICDNQAQDYWAAQFSGLSKALSEQFAIAGRRVVREAVRRYAIAQGKVRKEYLSQCSKKPNLLNLFTKGGPMPCGERCGKEWIALTPQEVFVNITACPYAELWNAQGEAEYGKMFCEEFYPAYIHEAASGRAQINVGKNLVNEGDNMCRLSFYLRPANLDACARAQIFEEYDPKYTQEPPMPAQPIDYQLLSEQMYELMSSCASEQLGEEGVACVRAAALSIARNCKNERMLHHLK